MATGDSYKRLQVAENEYQCGCYWGRNEYGDVLHECPIHAAATVASVEKFERERTEKGGK